MRQKYQQELTRLIRENVAPDINLKLEQYSSGGYVVQGVTVVEGKEPPYHRIPGNDIYVRRGASNIKPSPQELQALFSEAGSNVHGVTFGRSRRGL